MGSDILIVQSGKQYGRKYLVEALQALKSVVSTRLSFKIAGVLVDKEEVSNLTVTIALRYCLGFPQMNHPAVGEKEDIYGTSRQTATTQHAMC